MEQSEGLTRGTPSFSWSITGSVSTPAFVTSIGW